MKTTDRLSAMVLLAMACGGCLPTLWDSKLGASDGRFEKLEDAAKARGWGAERSAQGSNDGACFWYLKVNPKPDETIYFTKNNQTLPQEVAAAQNRVMAGAGPGAG